MDIARYRRPLLSDLSRIQLRSPQPTHHLYLNSLDKLLPLPALFSYRVLFHLCQVPRFQVKLIPMPLCSLRMPCRKQEGIGLRLNEGSMMLYKRTLRGHHRMSARRRVDPSCVRIRFSLPRGKENCQIQKVLCSGESSMTRRQA